MELQPENVIHVLTFRTPGLGFNSVMYVCSPHIAIIEKFILLHLTEDAKNNVETYAPQDLPDEIMKNIHDYMLKYHKFKENGSDETFIVPTNRKILEECASNVCSDLSVACEFGDIITQTDIPIMDVLSELIGSLDYAVVLDVQKVNNDTDDSLDHTDVFKQKIYNIYGKTPGEFDDFYIYDTLMTDSLDGEYDITPFTVSGYVTGFTQLLFDPREWR